MYKKFFISIIGIAVIVNIFQFLLAYLLSNENCWDDNHPTITLTKHREIARNINDSKILVIGGSSTLLGVNTELMSETLNYPVVNLGSSAGLTLDYILYDAKRSINNNDIVILPIEYGIYYNDDLSEYKVVQIWQNDKQYFNCMSFNDKLKLLYGIPLNLEIKVLSSYIGLSINRSKDFVFIDTNKTGDSINTLETKKAAIQLKEPFNKNLIYLDDETKKTIIDFLNYCKEKNVKVFVTYPPYYYNQKHFDGYNLEQINKINDFWQDQDVTILGQYTDFIYTDKNDFYDSQYHLNIKGREKRTEKLIELLKPYINNN